MFQMHTISSLQIELDVADQDTAFQLRHQFANYWQESVVNYLERAFERLAGENEFIRIKRLEIDLGELDFEDFGTDFPYHLQNAIDKSLKNCFDTKKENVVETNAVGSDLDLLIHFLETGRLPWWCADGENLDTGKMLLDLLENDKYSLKSIFTKALNNEQSIKRILYQFDNDLIVKVLIQLFEIGNTVFLIEKAIDSTLSADSETFFPLKHKSIFTAFVLLYILKHEFAVTVNKSILEKAEEYFDENQRMYLAKIVDVLSADKLIQLTDASVEQKSKNLNFSNASDDKSDKYAIKNAGLVLLAPFFPQLFSALNYLVKEGEHKGQFKDRFTAYRAVLLLAYLSHGETVSPEYTLCFEKILCGLNIDEPVPMSIELTVEEQTEANELLQAVIAHWTVLRSVDGLRGSFLLREGMLYKQGNKWLLRVERKTHDVLLDHKPPPWGFGLLKFSWNPKLIETEW